VQARKRLKIREKKETSQRKSSDEKPKPIQRSLSQPNFAEGDNKIISATKEAQSEQNSSALRASEQSSESAQTQSKSEVNKTSLLSDDHEEDQNSRSLTHYSEERFSCSSVHASQSEDAELSNNSLSEAYTESNATETDFMDFLRSGAVRR